MAPPTRTPRSEWIRQGLRALAQGGPDAVRIEPLAKELGVSRGGFYWHFADRGALLAAMLDTWERTTTQEVAEHLESEGGDTLAKLRRLFTLTSPSVVQTDLAIRDWARRDHAVTEPLRRIDNRRMDYLRALFAGLSADPAEVEARCLLTFSLLIGNHYITADHGSNSRAGVLDMALRQLAAAENGPAGRSLGPGSAPAYRPKRDGIPAYMTLSEFRRGQSRGDAAQLPHCPPSHDRRPPLGQCWLAAHARVAGDRML